jgi:hypothetical protein
MEPPSNYFGPSQVFGLNNSEKAGYPIYLEVTDVAKKDCDFLPLKHKLSDLPDHLPESMKDAISSFIVSSAVRRLRGQGGKHNTMLIHCTRYNGIQARIGELVEEYFREFRESILNDDGDSVLKLKNVWSRDFNRISNEMKYPVHKWEEVLENIKPAIVKMERRPQIINGSAGDILDYKSKENIGLSVIVIGGDKLSRGLTLEGLTISYFTRTSSLYDTLMQMGRWFGYRTGFEDLCRIYTTSDLYSWYRHISTAFEKLREEFVEMSRQKATPLEFGIRVLSHPDMMATNAMKMRNSTSLPLTYKGRQTQTITYNISEIKSNFSATESFIKKLNVYREINSSYLWEGVPKSQVIDFLRNYHTYKGAPAANTLRIVEYINQQKTNNIVDNWNVALISLQRKNSKGLTFSGLDIRALRRGLKAPIENEKLYIGVLTGPEDESIDFVEKPKISGAELRRMSPRVNCPLLMIYPLEIEDLNGKLLELGSLTIGIAITWPNNDGLEEITYDINSVYSELELEYYD